jgi:SsrA-binding protein
MKDLARNKRARFDYIIEDTLEGSLLLLGTEVKSVKAGNMSLRGAFVTFKNNETWLTNATIPPWQPKNAPADYDPTRSRKVLLTKDEIKGLVGAKQAKGLTLVPIRVYTKGPRVKVEIGLARGKKKADKRQAKREADIQRDIDRVIRGKDY